MSNPSVQDRGALMFRFFRNWSAGFERGGTRDRASAQCLSLRVLEEQVTGETNPARRKPVNRREGPVKWTSPSLGSSINCPGVASHDW